MASSTDTSNDSPLTTFFFYGTLMAPSVLSRVTSHDILHPSRPLTKPRQGLLRAHRRHRVRSADYPAVIPSSDERAAVRGTLVTGFVESDVWRLDTFEGEEYERRRVRVEVVPVEQPAPDGKEEDPAADEEKLVESRGKTGERAEEIEAYTYIWTAGKDQLEDAEWDYEEFVREKMWRWAKGHAEADAGFDDIARELEEKQMAEHGLDPRSLDGGANGLGERGADPTGGRMLNGAFEEAVQSGDVEVKRDMMESAV